MDSVYTAVMWVAGAAGTPLALFGVYYFLTRPHVVLYRFPPYERKGEGGTVWRCKYLCQNQRDEDIMRAISFRIGVHQGLEWISNHSRPTECIKFVHGVHLHEQPEVFSQGVFVDGRQVVEICAPAGMRRLSTWLLVIDVEEKWHSSNILFEMKMPAKARLVPGVPGYELGDRYRPIFRGSNMPHSFEVGKSFGRAHVALILVTPILVSALTISVAMFFDATGGVAPGTLVFSAVLTMFLALFMMLVAAYGFIRLWADPPLLQGYHGDTLGSYTLCPKSLDSTILSIRKATVKNGHAMPHDHGDGGSQPVAGDEGDKPDS